MKHAAFALHRGPVPSWQFGTHDGSYDSQTEEPTHRLSYWNNSVNLENGVEIICATPNFIGRMSSRSLGRCSVHSVSIDTPHRAIRTKVQEDLCFANIQLHNDGAWFSGARQLAMPSGSMVLYDATSGYELDFLGASESLILAVSKADLIRRVPDLQDHLEQNRAYEPRMINLLAQMMQGVLAAPAHLKEAVSDMMTDGLLNMLVATIYQSEGDDRHAPTHGSAAVLWRIKSFVQANLANPELSPVLVAEAMGITVSHLHKLFLSNNATLMQYVLSERLERCRQDIAKSDRTGGISQVAYSWGFNDASHFSRSFRKHFGMSPREYRASVKARDAELRASRH